MCKTVSKIAVAVAVDVAVVVAVVVVAVVVVVAAVVVLGGPYRGQNAPAGRRTLQVPQKDNFWQDPWLSCRPLNKKGIIDNTVVKQQQSRFYDFIHKQSLAAQA